MNTTEIKDYLKGFSNFKGVFPKDLLTSSLTPKCGIVINTDNADEPGEHWVSIYKKSDNSAIYFDSFGLPPLHEEILDYLKLISPNGWYYNRLTFQSLYQDTCGMYCIYFLTSMFRCEDFKIFQRIFKYDSDFNDIFAKILYFTQKPRDYSV